MTFNLIERAKIEKLARLYIKTFHRNPSCESPCDILFLHRLESNISRTLPLVKELKEKFSLKIDHKVSSSKILKVALENPFSKPFESAQKYSFIYDHYASFLFRKHRPKVLVTFMDNAELSHSLRRQFNSQGSKVVNLSHGVTASDQNYEVYDFDYYFVYGQSSLEAALSQKKRRGSTNLVLTGSFLIRPTNIHHVAPNSNKIVYLSDGTPKADLAHIESIFKLLGDWAQRNPNKQLYFKHHPLEDISFSKSFFRGLKNLIFLPVQTTLAEAIAPCSVALTGWSNTAIETALMGRPIVSLNPSQKDDNFLKFSSFFGAQIQKAADLDEKIEWIKSNESVWKEQNRKFIEYHLSHSENAIETIAQCLHQIAVGNESFPSVSVRQTESVYRN